MKTRAVIVAAGLGQRAGLGYNKVLHYIGEKTVLETVLDKFLESGIDRITLVINKADEPEILNLTLPYKNITLAYGGDTRTQSVRNGLKATDPCDIVLIHDGARPFVTEEIIQSAIDSAITYGSGIAAVPSVDTVKEAAGDGEVLRTLKRDGLYNVQTPQVFKYPLIMKAYGMADGVFGDDSEVYEKAGFTAYLSKGSYDNIKLTAKEDFLRRARTNGKIGAGFDVHRLTAGRALILGGVKIAHYKGLLGHSDADVLTHAVMDALLSAAGLPDIGTLFPDSDIKYKDAVSIELLKKVNTKITESGYLIGNISAVIMAEKPKLSPHIPKMRELLAGVLNINYSQINISATTTESLGIIGEENGIASSASCILYPC